MATQFPQVLLHLEHENVYCFEHSKNAHNTHIEMTTEESHRKPHIKTTKACIMIVPKMSKKCEKLTNATIEKKKIPRKSSTRVGATK